MTHRQGHRAALPRSPRGRPQPQPSGRPSRAATSARAAQVGRQLKQAAKRAAIRDCGRRCVYCGHGLAIEAATLDHVVPLSQGGSHALGNLVTACRPCNQRKGDLLPAVFFARYPAAGLNFIRYARAVHRSLKRDARRAVSLALAA